MRRPNWLVAVDNWRTIQRRRFERMSLVEIIEYAERVGELRGARGERERIIALIEARKNKYRCLHQESCDCDAIVEYTNELIALIKGESAETSIETPQKL